MTPSPQKKQNMVFLCYCINLYPKYFFFFFFRDCANDLTCVLCINCFQQSVHKKHRYRVSIVNLLFQVGQFWISLLSQMFASCIFYLRLFYLFLSDNFFVISPSAEKWIRQGFFFFFLYWPSHYKTIVATNFLVIMKFCIWTIWNNIY